MAHKGTKRLAATIVLLIGAAAAADEVRIKGSDTIGGRLTPELAEAYHARHRGTAFAIEALGSATAFIGLCDRSADIGESSRPINERESENLKQFGLIVREVVVGYDGVAVIVNPTNTVGTLSVAQSSAIFTGRITNWKAVGGPNAPIRLISRPSYSGTHAFFKEKVLRRGNAKGPEEFAASTEYVEENGAIVAAVASDPNAISYVGLGWVKPEVKALPISARDGDPAILPAADTVRSGRYPLYRALLMYVPDPVKPAALDFVRFVLSPEGTAIVARNGFVAVDLSAGVPAFIAAAPSVAQEPTLVRPRTRTEPQQGADSAPASVATTTAASPSSTKVSAPVTTPVPETVRVAFASGSAALSTRAMAALIPVAEKLKRGGFTAVLTGNADATGPAGANERIARARALAVADYLAKLAVPPNRFRVNANGAGTPIATNTSAAGRGQNRRVDVVLFRVQN